jgi:DNA-binding LacI/PurR family transcriptional regulator
VPDDFSVIVFDNIQIATVTIRPLTTIQISRYELARAAVSALRAHMEKPGEPIQGRGSKIQNELVVRESTNFQRGTMRHLRE